MPSREEMLEWLRRNGANVTNTVSKRTSVLIIGDDPGGTKQERARQLGIPTIYWPVFIHLGLAENRSGYQLSGDIDNAIINELAVVMATIYEDIYGQALAGSERHGRALEPVARAIEGLLCTSYGPSTGTAT
jgi:hypothetical protein